MDMTGLFASAVIGLPFAVIMNGAAIKSKSNFVKALALLVDAYLVIALVVSALALFLSGSAALPASAGLR